MTLSGATAKYQLNTGVTPTGVKVDQPNRIGYDLSSVSFSDANVVYSFSITATAASDSATLDLKTGVITKTAGTPNVARRTGGTSDLAALDFEGKAISNVATGKAILIVPTVHVGTIAVSASLAGVPVYQFSPASSMPILGPFVPSGNATFSFGNTADSVSVIVIGKTA